MTVSETTRVCPSSPFCIIPCAPKNLLSPKAVALSVTALLILLQAPETEAVLPAVPAAMALNTIASAGSLALLLNPAVLGTVLFCGGIAWAVRSTIDREPLIPPKSIRKLGMKDDPHYIEASIIG